MSIFGFIGIIVLVSLWGGSSDFGRPPLVFRLFGSMIAMAFILMGFGMPLSLLRKSRGKAGLLDGTISKPPPSQMDCPNCGANLGKAEVSPSGDVKCSYCNGWFNIHQK